MAKQRLTHGFHFTLWIIFLNLGSITWAHECGPESMTVGVGEDKMLTEWADWIRSQNAKTVYAYFNNDVGGHAVRNAETLKQLLKVG